MESVVFWIVWGLISYWALQTFYFSFSWEKIERLRKATLGFHLTIVILAFLPWFPPALGGSSGLSLALTGNMLALLFLVLIMLSAILFLTNKSSLMKIAAGLTFTNTLIFIALMFSLHATTFALTLYDVAPIIAFLVLLICNVAVLLLWRQLQLKEKRVKKRPSQLGKAIIFFGIAMLVVLGFVFFRSQGSDGQNAISMVSHLLEVQEFKRAVEENGKSRFSIAVDRQDGPYFVIKVFESFPDHITTFNWYRVGNKTAKVERLDIATDTWNEAK